MTREVNPGDLCGPLGLPASISTKNKAAQNSKRSNQAGTPKDRNRKPYTWKRTKGGR